MGHTNSRTWRKRLSDLWEFQGSLILKVRSRLVIKPCQSLMDTHTTPLCSTENVICATFNTYKNWILPLLNCPFFQNQHAKSNHLLAAGKDVNVATLTDKCSVWSFGLGLFPPPHTHTPILECGCRGVSVLAKFPGRKQGIDFCMQVFTSLQNDSNLKIYL